MKSLLPRYSHQADYESIDDGEDLSSRRTKEHSEGRSQGNILERTFRIDDAISKGLQLKFMEVEGKTNIEEKWSSKRGLAWFGIVARLFGNVSLEVVQASDFQISKLYKSACHSIIGTGTGTGMGWISFLRRKHSTKITQIENQVIACLLSGISMEKCIQGEL